MVWILGVSEIQTSMDIFDKNVPEIQNFVMTSDTLFVYNQTGVDFMNPFTLYAKLLHSALNFYA